MCFDGPTHPHLECVCVALGIQCAMRTRHIEICGLPGSKIFFLSHKRHDFTEKKLLIFFISSTTFVGNVSHFKNEQNMINIYFCPHVKFQAGRTTHTHTHTHTHNTGSKLRCQTPTKHTTNIYEALQVISVKQSSVLPDDGSRKIRNMSEWFLILCLLNFYTV